MSTDSYLAEFDGATKLDMTHKPAHLALLSMSASLLICCDAPGSKEDLNPDGPPMVRQVLVTEKVIVNDAPRVLEGQLAFGSHDAAFFDDDDGTVATAIAVGAQEIRVVLDELVRGNALEEIACADGSFSRIPDGTTPDDIADCAGPVDSILSCSRVCIGADGAPIGIMDANDDGSADDMRMIDYGGGELGVSVVCDDVIVPLDPEFSFWSPSGNQTFPSNGALGFRGIGPAIVLKPLADIGLRTGADCQVRFRPEVTDYEGNAVCAPTGGLPSEGCSGADTDKIHFNTEVLSLVNSIPKADASEVALNSAGLLLFTFNANLDAETRGAITMTANGVPVAIAPVIEEGDLSTVLIQMTEDFLPNTEYQVTLSTSLTDQLGGALAADELVTFRTASL